MLKGAAFPGVLLNLFLIKIQYVGRHLLSEWLESGLSSMSMSCKAGRLLCVDSGDRACLSQSAEASQNVGSLHAAVSAAGRVRCNLAMVLSWEE